MSDRYGNITLSLLHASPNWSFQPALGPVWDEVTLDKLVGISNLKGREHAFSGNSLAEETGDVIQTIAIPRDQEKSSHTTKNWKAKDVLSFPACLFCFRLLVRHKRDFFRERTFATVVHGGDVDLDRGIRRQVLEGEVEIRW
ncbi:MAG: hypothetical protein JWM68_5728 [Verrucomicrobiales bacterium]|nr:hypothetical protein [Verrucomicrobiales bacterium]